MIDHERRILLGRILGAFGVRGEVKIDSYTEPAKSLLKYQPWQLSHRGSEQEIDGVRGREASKGLVAALPGIEDRDAAEALKGAEIWVPRSRLPTPKPGEYYWVDLEGLAVVNREGIAFGMVSHLFDTGANDVLVVSGERERLIPFVPEQYVLSVDFDTRTITVDWDADF